MIANPICTECEFHKSTSSGDRCGHPDLERRPARDPVTGKQGFVTEFQGWSSNRHIYCHEYNTLKNPCQLFQEKETGNG